VALIPKSPKLIACLMALSSAAAAALIVKAAAITSTPSKLLKPESTSGAFVGGTVVALSLSVLNHDSLDL
jgi:hypothetical protein